MQTRNSAFQKLMSRLLILSTHIRWTFFQFPAYVIFSSSPTLLVLMSNWAWRSDINLFTLYLCELRKKSGLMRWTSGRSRNFLRHGLVSFLMTKRTHRQGFVFISNHFRLLAFTQAEISTHMMTKRVLRARKIHLYLAVTTRFNAHEWGMFVCKFDADKRHYAVNGNFYENELSLFSPVTLFRCCFLEARRVHAMKSCSCIPARSKKLWNCCEEFTFSGASASVLMSMKAFSLYLFTSPSKTIYQITFS